MYQNHVSTTRPLGPGAFVSEPVDFISPTTSRDGVSLAGLHRNAESQSLFATGAYEQHMPSLPPNTSFMQNESVYSVEPDQSGASSLCFEDASVVADVNNERVTSAASSSSFVPNLSYTAADDNSSCREWYDDIDNRVFKDIIEKEPLSIDITKVNFEVFDPPTQTLMAHVDMANESNSYRPLDIPACGFYSGTSCGLTTATLNNTSPTKRKAGTTSSTFSTNIGSATNVSTAALSKHVNAYVNSPSSTDDANTCTTHASSDVLDVSGPSAAAPVLSDPPVQFINPVKNRPQFQTGASNSVRSSGAAVSIGSSKKLLVAPEECRFCGRINRISQRHNLKRVCRYCAKSFLADPTVQFANPVKDKSQFRTGILYSLPTSNSVRPVRSNKEVDVKQKKGCRVCSSLRSVFIHNGICHACTDFFRRNSWEDVQVFYPCIKGTNCCDIKYIKGKQIGCKYCRLVKCRASGMKK